MAAMLTERQSDDPATGSDLRARAEALVPDLAATGWDIDAEALLALLAGAAAAPPGRDGRAWSALLPAGLADATVDNLAALKAALADRPPSSEPRDRLMALRSHLAALTLDGVVVPHGGSYPGEDVPAAEQRLAWLTGFTGSAGLAVVLSDRAALFVDGRYTVQAAAQVDADRFALKHLLDDPADAWAAGKMAPGSRLGFDPRLHSVQWMERTRRTLEEAGHHLIPLDRNPVDAVWHDRPAMPLSVLRPHPMALAGRSSADKRTQIAEAMIRDGVDATVLTAPDSIAWLLNVRAGDAAHTPIAFASAILDTDGHVTLFVDRRKLTPAVIAHLGNAVTVAAEDALGPTLDRLGQDERRLQADPDTASAWVFERLHRAGAPVKRAPDPCQRPKACKTEAELAGARRAHLTDAVAVVRFLAWLDRTAPSGTLSERAAAAALERLRRDDGGYAGPSFETIAGSGPNGAIVHYRVTADTDRLLAPGDLFLVDSGGQYGEGTTDITRTIAIGPPPAEARHRATLVLKGHIAVATIRFPKGTTGAQIDPLARQFLWGARLDYDHGTGHGVGSVLCVHEGPARIAKRASHVPLEPGMILSNEPGYYAVGRYGIRIENLVAVTALPAEDGDPPFYGFETLTFAPIDRRLISPDLLTAEERAWLDAYHADVAARIGPRLADPADRAWLDAATQPL